MQNYKNVLLIGMNGRIGRVVVQYAVKNFFVHCLIRSAPQLGLNSIFFKIVDGDALKPEQLQSAAEGKDAVISTYGVSNNQNPKAIEQYTRILIEAMKKKGVKKLVAVGSSGSLKNGESLYLESANYPQNLKVRAQDHHSALKLLEQSGLEFSVVCPHRVENSQTEAIEITADGTDSAVGIRALAKYLVSLVTENNYQKKVIGVKSP